MQKLERNPFLDSALINTFTQHNLADHHCVRKGTFERNILGIPERKLEKINDIIYEMFTVPASHKNNETDTITAEDILPQGIIKIETLKSKNVYPKITNTNTLHVKITQQLTNSSDSVIKLDI